MSEVDSAICKMKEEWSCVTYDLLSNIANRLELIDFTCFHCVCKDWRYATEPLHEAIFSGCDPWFLLYGEEGPRCSVLINNDKVYTVQIPELDRSTCLASYDGWLLVFRHDSLFFFCPFSGAKIQLPNCPLTKSHDYIAAISSAPTSQDCIVVVLDRPNHFQFELHTLCRGDDIWVKYQFNLNEHLFPLKRCAMFIEGVFIYASNKDVFIFDVANTKQWSKCSLRSIQDQPDDESGLKCRLKDLLSKKAKKEKKHKSKDLKRKLGYDDNVAIATCGTIYDAQNMVWGKFIHSVTGSNSRPLKGVWIVPRDHKHQDQIW